MMTQELDLEDPLAIVQRLNADDGAAMIVALTDDEAQTLVDRLKAGADKYWAINPNRSLEMADTIIKIAKGRDNLSHKALGMMARGDALKLLGHSLEAWDALGDAGEIFLQLGDEVGWARTRIGRVFLCASINRVEEALVDAEQALEIFARHDAQSYLIKLRSNVASVYYWLGKPQQSLHWYHSARFIAESLALAGKEFLGLIYMNLGVVYWHLQGNYHAASEYLQQALNISIERNERKNIALIKYNTAFILIGQGKYLQALQLLYYARDLLNAEQLEFDSNYVNRDIVDCYLMLNRFVEARELALVVAANFHFSKSRYDEAHSLLHLSTAEAELSNLDSAQMRLSAAQDIFEELNANTWIAVVQMRKSELALKLGELDRSYLEISAAVTYFESSDQQIHLANALLALARIHFANGNVEKAKHAATNSLYLAQRTRLPNILYGSHLLLGRIAEAQGDLIRAIRRYYAAIGTIERVQQGLTITLRTGFGENKEEAFHALLALYLRLNDGIKAFEILERTKSLIFLSYITNRQLLRWPQSDPLCQELIQEFEQLRGEHYWWYQIAYGETKDTQAQPIIMAREGAIKEVTSRERRLRAITEQLYIQSGTNAQFLPTVMPNLLDIQKRIESNELLIEYYHDGKSLWVFTLDASTCVVYPLAASLEEFERKLDLLYFNIDTVLGLKSDSLQYSALTKQVKYILQETYNDLILPFASRLRNYRRLFFVPFGSLHYLPFHLLYSGATYLIEQHEIITLPAAGYVIQNSPKRNSGARVLAYSLNGALPHALYEAHLVHDLFGGSVYLEDASSRLALQEIPTQILHIATHAEYRPKQPDLSYIELADGHLLTDDLFQQDMSYELVTLSACETGRSHIASSDELIGLGRGFLYAGAGALVASLWRVIDDVTPRLMQYFYRELYNGLSKAAALRTAQLTILNDDPQMHPALWGAFQLVGDPRPLSSNPSTKNTR